MSKIISGVYKITNLVNGKMYVGGSVDIDTRWRVHTRKLKGEFHDNSHLQRAWNKYKESSFKFEIVEVVSDRENVPIREQWYLDNVVKYGFDYNIAKDVIAPNRDRNHSKETKRKMSESQMGHIVSDETKEKISISKRGCKLSDEHKKKLSIAFTGKRNHFWGKTHTEETKKRMSKDRSGEKSALFGIASESHPQAKLTQVEAEDIRKRYASGNYRQWELANAYDVSQSIISDIITNKTYNTHSI